MDFDELFALAPCGAGRWTAPAAPLTGEKRLFGGTLIGQAIVAASAGTRRCHSLHALFIGVGAMQHPFDVAVETTRNGGSFATRRVEIAQQDKLLLAAYTSHHDGDDGPAHQLAMPELPPPEWLDDQRLIRAKAAAARGTVTRHYLTDEMLDARPVELPPAASGPATPTRAIWFKARAPITGGPDIHRAAIGFASDMGLIHAGLLEHFRGGGFPVQAASLDHSIWFHRDADANGWLLQVQSAQVAALGRGLSRADIYTRDGTLVASATQEFLARRQRGDGV